MKKLQSFVLLSFIICRASAQCTPNLSCLASGASSGVCPDNSTGLAVGTVGLPYSDVVSLKIPADGSDFGQPLATIVSIDITGVDSLAPGLSYTCSASGCSFPGHSNGCIHISGTPTAVWNHQVVVRAVAHVKIFFVNTTQNETFKQYRSVVIDPAGVETLDLAKLELGQNSPNPFNAQTEIRFTSPGNEEIRIKVCNLLGETVYERSLKAETGLNRLSLEAGIFTPGIYMYSITNGGQILSKRMIVSGE